jgi:GNAT superfamily N-acetyltransferase
MMIILYQPEHQPDIDKMMLEIASEFTMSFYDPTYRAKLPDQYWVVLHDDQVVGTAGINVLSGYAVLKRMFLKKDFRGREHGVAALLLQTTFCWCQENNIANMYLGTMAQFAAAQRFYEKNGFEKIPANELPADFPGNPVDTEFYKIYLSGKRDLPTGSLNCIHLK